MLVPLEMERRRFLLRWDGMGWDGGSVKWIDLILLLVFMLMEREIQSNSFEVVFLVVLVSSSFFSKQ